MMGCTVEKKTASGTRVRAIRLRQVMVMASANSHRTGWPVDSRREGRAGARTADALTADAPRGGPTIVALARAAFIGRRPVALVPCILVLGAAAGQAQEHVVEAWLTQGHPNDRDLMLVEGPQDLDAHPGAVLDVQLDHGAVAHRGGAGRLGQERAACSAVASSASVTSITVCPRLAFSSAGVPSAMTLPWSMTTTRLARRSASSRYWVVSRTVAPSSTSFSMTGQRSWRLWGSSPVVGSSRKRTGGRADQGRGQVESTTHAS